MIVKNAGFMTSIFLPGQIIPVLAEYMEKNNTFYAVRETLLVACWSLCGINEGNSVELDDSYLFRLMGDFARRDLTRKPFL